MSSTSDRPELHQATEMPDTIDHKILTIFFKEKAPRKLKTVHDLIERNKVRACNIAHSRLWYGVAVPWYAVCCAR